MPIINIIEILWNGLFQGVTFYAENQIEKPADASLILELENNLTFDDFSNLSLLV